MGHPNNPFISSKTREWVSATSKASPDLLGGHTLPLIFKCLRATIHQHPGGIIHGLSRTMGASEELAIEAAVCGELFFSACNLTDDLQDGDTRRYLKGVSPALQLNTQSLLYSLAGVAVNAFNKKCEGSLPPWIFSRRYAQC